MPLIGCTGRLATDAVNDQSPFVVHLIEPCEKQKSLSFLFYFNGASLRTSFKVFLHNPRYKLCNSIMLVSHIGSSGDAMVCKARGLGFKPRSRHNDLRYWVSPASKLQYDWNNVKRIFFFLFITFCNTHFQWLWHQKFAAFLPCNKWRRHIAEQCNVARLWKCFKNVFLKNKLEWW